MALKDIKANLIRSNLRNNTIFVAASDGRWNYGPVSFIQMLLTSETGPHPSREAAEQAFEAELKDVEI